MPHCSHQKILPEIELQKRVHCWLEGFGNVLFDTDGVPLQVLSAGTINTSAGPDFTDIALLRKGELLIGNAEVHFNENDWYAHGHHLDASYNTVLLHLVVETAERRVATVACTLTIPPEVAILPAKGDDSAAGGDSNSVIDIWELSLRRLQRKGEDFPSLEEEEKCSATAQNAIARLQRAGGRRRRPAHGKLYYHADIAGERSIRLVQSLIFARHYAEAQQNIAAFLSCEIAGEGTSTRGEILVNIVFPIWLNEIDKLRKSLLLQAWKELPAFQRYHSLSKKFPSIAQQKVWQQQGLLEYMRFSPSIDLIRENAFPYRATG